MDLNEPTAQADLATRKLILDQPLTRLLSPFKRQLDSGVTEKEAELKKEELGRSDRDRVNRTKKRIMLAKDYRIHPEQFYRSGQPVITKKDGALVKSVSNTYSKV